MGLVAVVAGSLFVVGHFYWKHLQTTPQYSIALLVDAAKTGEDAILLEYIDSDAVVDSLVPQVVEKAVELYGRGLPAGLLGKAAALAAPLMPILKQRVRAELPAMLRREAEPFSDVPFLAIVVAADRYLEIETAGETAMVRSRLSEHGFEVTMRRNGDKWLVSGVRDEGLAHRIAEVLGQQMLAFASGGDLKKAAESLGVKDLDQIIKGVEKLIR